MRDAIRRRGPELVAGTFALSVAFLAAIFESGELGGSPFDHFYPALMTFPLSVITVVVFKLIESLDPSLLFNSIAPRVMRSLPGMLEALLMWYCLRRGRRPRSAKGWSEALDWSGEALALFASIVVCATGALILADPRLARFEGSMLLALGVLQAFFVLVHLRNRITANDHS